MDMIFHNKQIEGILSILPEHLSCFEDEVINPDDPKTQRLKRIIGYGSRRRAKSTTTMSDMFIFGLSKIINDGHLKKDEIGAIVVVTLCQDYMLPQVSTIIHGELGLASDIFCVDIPQACSGYITGLIEAFMLLDHLSERKVVLCTGEILNRHPYEDLRVEHPSFGGDVANISIIGNDSTGSDAEIFVSIENDGSKRNALIIEYGGFRKPMTGELASDVHNSLPCSGVNMDGSGVFNFVQKEVPPMVKALIKKSRHFVDEFDYFFFHQPNRFMLQKLANALGVPFEKMPMDITETLGNSDSGTIPVAMTTHAAEELKEEMHLCCLAGFGGGLTWGAIVMRIGNLRFCDNVIAPL